MKISVSRPILLNGLANCLGVIERKSTIPILAYIVIEASTEPSMIRIMASSKDMDILSSHDADVEKQGIAAFPGRKFYEIIREMDSDVIRIDVDKKHKITIRGGNAAYELPGLSPDDFPNIHGSQDITTFKVSAPALRDLIDWTSFAICKDEMRGNLCGVFLETEDDAENARRIKLTATDGHRLAYAYSHPEDAGDFALEKGVIIPKKSISEIRGLLDGVEYDIEISVENGRLFLINGNITYSTCLVDGTYPDYRRVLPIQDDVATVLVFDRDVLRSVLKRISVMTTEAYNAVVITIDEETVTFSTTHPDLGKVSENIDVHHDAIHITIGFNCDYLMDAVKVIKDRDAIFQILKGQENKRMIIKGADNDQHTCVLMALKV